MKKLVASLALFIFVFGVLAGYTTVKADDTEAWTDFSNAKFEIQYKTNGEIKYSDVTLNSNSSYFYTITPNNTKPEFNANTWEHSISSDTLRNASKYIELNQDLYLWIVESKDYSNTNIKYVVEGKKLERTGYKKDYNLFRNSFISSDEVQIVFNDIAWTDHTRNIKLKIGKVTSTDILNNIKNNKSDSFSKLLEYSKTSPAIYDNTLVSSKNNVGYYNGYSTFGSFDGKLISIDSSKIETNAYYYVYVQLDDENGKYYPVEAVTLAHSHMFENVQGRWSLFLYGATNFKWSEVDNGTTEESTSETPTSTSTSTSTVTPKKDPGDETTATAILPKTGINISILILIISLAVFAVISRKQYAKWKNIK